MHINVCVSEQYIFVVKIKHFNSLDLFSWGGCENAKAYQIRFKNSKFQKVSAANNNTLSFYRHSF